MKILLRVSIIGLALSLVSCAPASAQPKPAAAALPGEAPPPAAPREFRGVWVASVNNGQWPSAPGLPVDQQKKEMYDILDRCVALNVNADPRPSFTSPPTRTSRQVKLPAVSFVLK